jgi:Family of unknown function (DUF5309)
VSIITGRRTTANQPAGTVKVSVDEMLELLEVDDVPLLKRLRRDSTDNWKHEWLEEGLDYQVITATAASAAASLTVTVGTTDILAVRPRDVWRKQNGNVHVMFEVASVNTGAGTFALVARPGFGTTDEAIATNDKLELIAQVPLEGDDPQEVRGTDITRNDNYTEIFQEKISASTTEQLIAKYGPRDVMDHEAFKKFRELNIRMERALMFGRKWKSADSRQRLMGGFEYFLAPTYVTSGTKATDGVKKILRNAQKEAYRLGGAPKLLVCSESIKAEFDDLDSQLIRIEQGDNVVGTERTFFRSSYGRVELLMSRYLPPTDSYLLDERYVKVRSLRPFVYEPLAKTGDSENAQIVGEHTLQLKNLGAHRKVVVSDLT